MEDSLSSKVTVEYHDPSGLFPLISGDLASRLPLRNLHWKSPTRPLRSIGALHVEFVPDAATAARTEKAQLQRADSTGPAVVPGADTVTGGKERRHQIPGMMQTPYLKIYLLRCDDKDAYKAESRQLLRDWVRENSAPTQTSSSKPNTTENHDACDWLILHVVIPDTVAASEPRWTAASSKDPDELVERPQSTAVWPGKSTRTVLDKIRADFTVPTKSTVEKVAQLRLQKKDFPPQYLPKSPVPTIYTETAQEQDVAWQDLVAKFKTLILMSFDLRVTQYEEDIREKDSQRSLPGWNFCTFFTLKEGLARGFESVGLVEDALAIYDELSAGLDNAVHDDPQATFLGDMKVSRESLRCVLESAPDADKVDERAQDLFSKPLDLTKKDYRGEIVKNTISLFDFRVYIFARQRTLLLRLGAGTAPAQQKRPQTGQGNKDDNLNFPAEVCRRTAAFAATNSRSLRRGLQTGSEIEASSTFDILVENVASSWTYAVLQQILAETASEKLPLPKNPGDAAAARFSQAPNGNPRAKDPNAFNFGQGANPHPNRSTSLGQRSASGSSNPPQSPQVIFEDARFSKASVPTNPAASHAVPGNAGLAAGRAELFMMQRKVLEAVAKRKGWSTGWSALMKTSSLSDVDLNASSEAEEAAPTDAAAPSSPDAISDRLLTPSLAYPLVSVEAFRSAYELLSNQALSHYTIANHAKSAEVIVSDLAILKYQMSNYSQAATLFQKSAPSYLHGHWTYVHGEMLRAYAKCLLELHRRDEYMRVMLSLLSKVIVRQRDRTLPKLRSSKQETSPAWFDDQSVDVEGVIGQLSVFSKELPYNFTAPLMDFFADVHVSHEILHYDDKDGFALDVQFRHLLEDDLTLDQVRLRLSNAQDVSQEIWLQSDGQVDLKRGLVKLKLHSNITTYGLYLVDKLVLETNKLHFIHEFQPKAKPTPLGITNASSSDSTSAATGPSILVYPHGNALDARAVLTKKIHVEKLRNIIVEVDTGRNDVDSLDIRLRAASAGLRLHTADAVILENKINLEIQQSGQLHIGPQSANTKLRISLPYSLEHGLGEVTVRVEAQYNTSDGSFIFLSTNVILVALPLDVDVHDIFKAESIFSRFSIRTTNSIPLQVTGVQLKDSVAFAVKPLPCPSLMTVFEKQPASLTYSITKKPVKEGSELSRKEVALAMTVQYLCISDLMLDRIESALRVALEDSPYANLKRLLIPLLRNGAQSHSLALQFEKAVLLHELVLPVYQEVGWDKVIHNLSASLKSGLTEWLQGWHKQNKRISFDPTAAPEVREITISVDVPIIDVMHTATLSIPSAPRSTTAHPATATLGSPLLAELRIKHTRRWHSPSKPPPEGALDFVYILRETPESWLIGGQRRAHFTLENESDERVFPIVLIPLKAGAILLPTVDIQAVATVADKRISGQWNEKVHDRENSNIGGIGGDGAEASISCETDYRSSAEMVLVVRDSRKTSVTVRESAPVLTGGDMLSVGGGGGGRPNSARLSTDTTLSRMGM